MQTEIVDKLYLELSHLTDAKTYKELQMERRIKVLEEAIKVIASIENDHEENDEKIKRIFRICEDVEFKVLIK